MTNQPAPRSVASDDPTTRHEPREWLLIEPDPTEEFPVLNILKDDDLPNAE